jgi:hypothetical protein
MVRRFGAASLSIVPGPRVTGGDNGGNDCIAQIDAQSGSNSVYLELQSSSKWDTDTWAQNSPPSSVQPGYSVVVDGGLGRGCHNETVWGASGGATITIDVTWEWRKLPVSTCKVSNQAARCWRADQNGEIVWVIQSA